MNRPRLPLGLESSRATLNAVVCAATGRQLAAERQAQSLSVDEVASRLLLSPAQVIGIERAQSEAFYSADFYTAAARKYADLLGLEVHALSDMRVVPELDDDRRVQAAGGAASGRLAWVALASTVAALVVTGSAFVGWRLIEGTRQAPAAFGTAGPAPYPTISHLVSTTLPPMPIAVTLEPPASGAAERAGAASGSAFGHIVVERTTWVFVRYSDNSTVERVVSAGGRFELSGLPIYLAVGSAPGTKVVLVGDEIDTAPFSVGGQLRIGAASLSAAIRP